MAMQGIVYHGRWWVRLRSGRIVKWINDEGIETPFREVQRRAADDPIQEIGWEPVGEVVANLASARGTPMVPNAIEPQSIEVPEGVRDVLPPVEIEERVNVGAKGQTGRGPARAMTYQVQINGEPVLTVTPRR